MPQFQAICSPSDVNGVVRCLTAPAVPGPGVCASNCLSNVDMNGKLVKRGVTVSYHGLRYQVVTVRQGRFVGRRPSLVVGKLYLCEDRLPCKLVQVVA